MIAFDTDVLSEILLGHEEYSQRAAAIPPAEQAVPLIVIEELLRGRLNAIRKAESRKLRLTLPRAYALFAETLHAVRGLIVLSYTPGADALVREWRKQKLRVGTQDLRIAATCIDANATLVSRNRRDFEMIPGLSVEFWG